MICTSARFIECSRDEVRRGHRVEVPGVFAVSYADQVHRFLFMFFFPFLCCDFFLRENVGYVYFVSIGWL